MWVEPQKVIDIQTLVDKLPQLPRDALLFITGAAEMALTMSQAHMDMAEDLIVDQAIQKQ